MTVVPILPFRAMWLTTGEKVYFSVPAGVGTVMFGLMPLSPVSGLAGSGISQVMPSTAWTAGMSMTVCVLSPSRT